MDQLTELRPPDFTDVTKWWIFSNKSLLVCLGGGVIAYLLFKITAMIHLAFLGVWLGVMLEVGLFIGVTFPVPDFGSSLLAFGHHCFSPQVQTCRKQTGHMALRSFLLRDREEQNWTF